MLGRASSANAKELNGMSELDEGYKVSEDLIVLR